MQQPVSVLFVGDVRRPEFGAAVRWLTGHAHTIWSASVADSERQLAKLARPPEIIVIAESRPGEYPLEQIDRLRELAPVAHLVSLLGSWCEGEPRSGRPWPGVFRTYWYRWPVVAARQLGQLATGACPMWGLPVTATDEERLLHEVSRPLPQRAGLIALSARHAETCRALSDACRLFGFATVSLVSQQNVHMTGADAVLWDGEMIVDQSLRELDRLKRLFDPAPVLALLLYPRSEDVKKVQSVGAAGVLAKPFSLHDLDAELDRLIRAPEGRPAVTSAG